MDHIDDAPSGLDPRTTERLDELRARLDGIAEELTDVSMEVLREAIDRGETSRPTIDKTLAQARRAVERAARLLEA